MTPQPNSFSSQRTSFCLLVCFIGSGMSGLIYEVAWVRSLELIFGATTFAIATVLAAFMGGLAVGSYLMGLTAGRLSRFHPLIIYGVLEILIAVCGVVIPSLFQSLIPLYQKMWSQFHASFLVFTLIRFGLCAVILLVPTFLMGATLPIVSGFVGGRSSQGTRRIGLLYTFNTAGAVLGCAAAGLVLFPSIGLAKTQWVAIGLNLLAAAGAFILARKSRRRYLDVDASAQMEAIRARSASSATTQRPRMSGQIGWLVAAYAVSGFCAMLYEVAWSRVLVMVLGSSTYAYTIMLATFLFGLTLGAYLAARFLSRTDFAVALAGGCQVFVALTTYLSVHLVEDLPFFYLKAFHGLHASGYGLLGVQFFLSAVLMVVPTLGLGAMFPIVVRGLNPTGDETARRVGWAYALNTVGAIVGSIIAGFWLVPHWGSRNTMLVGISLNALLGLLCVLAVPLERFKRFRPALAIVVVLFIASLYVGPSHWRPYVLSSGMFRYVENYHGLNQKQFEDRMRENRGQILYFDEGLTCTVTVCRSATGISLLVNGKPDASVPTDLRNPLAQTEQPRLREGDLGTQVLLGQAPLLLAPKRDRVMVIGLGSGVTLGSVLRHPVKQVECVELEDAVVQASRFFEHYNGKPLQDSRVKLVVNDARNHLLVTDQQYDVIISEPSNPWIAGAASLFTSEFFRTARTRLQPDGVFCQWVQLYELRSQDFQAILRSFTDVFPHVHIFRVDMDAIVVGSTQPNTLDYDQLAARLTPAVQADLAQIDARSVEDFLAHYWVGGQELTRSLPNGPRNSDDNMLIEFSAPLRMLSRNAAAQIGFVKELATLFQERSSGLIPQLKLSTSEPSAVSECWARVAQSSLQRKLAYEALRYAEHSLKTSPNAEAAQVKGDTLALGGKKDKAREWFAAAQVEFPGAPVLLRSLARFYQAEKELAAARSFAEELVGLDPENVGDQYLLGHILYQQKEYGLALARLEPLKQQKPIAAGFSELPYLLGSLYWNLRLYDRALEPLQEFLRTVPNHLDARYRLADSLFREGHHSEGFAEWQRVGQLRSSYAILRMQEGLKAWQGGQKATACVKLEDALEHDPANDEVNFNLARLYRQAGNIRGAIALLEKYLAISPDRPWAVGLLGQLTAAEGSGERAVALVSRYHALTGQPWRNLRE